MGTNAIRRPITYADHRAKVMRTICQHMSRRAWWPVAHATRLPTSDDLYDTFKAVGLPHCRVTPRMRTEYGRGIRAIIPSWESDHLQIRQVPGASSWLGIHNPSWCDYAEPFTRYYLNCTLAHVPELIERLVEAIMHAGIGCFIKIPEPAAAARFSGKPMCVLLATTTEAERTTGVMLRGVSQAKSHIFFRDPAPAFTRGLTVRGDHLIGVYAAEQPALVDNQPISFHRFVAEHIAAALQALPALHWRAPDEQIGAFARTALALAERNMYDAGYDITTARRR